jgi:hypothetical protein
MTIAHPIRPRRKRRLDLLCSHMEMDILPESRAGWTRENNRLSLRAITAQSIYNHDCREYDQQHERL